jgi:hypothetical protein
MRYRISMATTNQRGPRSLHEWMDRTGTSSRRLIQIVKATTGRDISETNMSFIVRGSRRCSKANAEAISAVTGVPVKVLRRWRKQPELDNSCGRDQKNVA